MKKVIAGILVGIVLLSAICYFIFFKVPLEGTSLIEKIYSLKDVDITTLFDKDTENKSSVETLYEFKGSSLKDESILRILVNSANMSAYNIDSIELPTDNTKRLNVKFMVDDRAKHRNKIDSASLDKTAVLLYSILNDMDQLCFYFFDNWSDPDVLETTFYSRFYDRNNLSERTSLNSFTADVIEKAASSEEEFTKFYDDVSKITQSPEDVAKADERTAFIGDDNEFVTNSAIGIHMMLNVDFFDSLEKMMLEGIFREVNFENYRDKIIYLTRYDTHNFKNDKYGYCAFIEYEGDIIAKKILTKAEADYIARLIGN